MRRESKHTLAVSRCVFDIKVGVRHDELISGKMRSTKETDELEGGGVLNEGLGSGVMQE